MLCLLLGGVVSAQVERPNATPYTIAATYQKLLKNYPDIVPVEPLQSDKIVCEEDLTYYQVDGVLLKADIYYPKDIAHKTPAVILVHGGGWISGSKENQRVMAQHLAENGFVDTSENSDFCLCETTCRPRQTTRFKRYTMVFRDGIPGIRKLAFSIRNPLRKSISCQ